MGKTMGKVSGRNDLPLYVKRTREAEPVKVTGAGIQAAFGNNLILWIGTDDEQRRMAVYTDRRVLVAILKKLLAAVELEDTPENMGANNITPAAAETISNWDWLTPQMVIDKFSNSPNLRGMLPDVKKVLGVSASVERARDDIKHVELELSPDDVFDESGTLKRGAKSRIAELLGVKYAGNYRKRVDSIIEQMAA